jgi:tRNA pseudouridine38-40 synthase
VTPRKIRLLISYDGTEYQGWQKQPGKPTLQGTLEEVLTQIYGEPVRVIGSGRTDSGTHAVGQVAHFTAPREINAEARLVRALNSLLPDDIVVKAAWRAPADFHALACARRKVYIYRIWNDPVRSALWRRRALWCPKPIDLACVNAMCEVITGEHDFKSFQTAGSETKTSVRRVYSARFEARRGSLVEFRIEGSGFLKQMVRNLVGTMLYLERTRGTVEEFSGILEARDRQRARATAPAHGLYLYRVTYPRALDKGCSKI